MPRDKLNFYFNCICFSLLKELILCLRNLSFKNQNKKKQKEKFTLNLREIYITYI
jgi:hypothetical protein